MWLIVTAEKHKDKLSVFWGHFYHLHAHAGMMSSKHMLTIFFYCYYEVPMTQTSVKQLAGIQKT